MFGPSDQELWQRRPLGAWESQLVLDFPPGVPGTFYNIDKVVTNIQLHLIDNLYHNISEDEIL